MFRAIAAFLESFAVGCFALTTLAIAGAERQAAPQVRSLASLDMLLRPVNAPAIPDVPMGIVAQPVNGVLWSLMWLAVGCAFLHVVVRLSRRFCAPPRVMVSVGLLAGAVAPWIVPHSQVLGLAIGVLGVLALVQGLFDDTAAHGDEDWGLMPLGIVTAWAMLSLMWAAGMAMQHRWGVDPQRAALLVLLAASLAGARIQLSLGRNIAFSLTLIWAMIGIAAAALGGSMTVATACVLGIASMAVVIVRVTT
ncbi:hypothetical protein [Paracoccus luteus]|uniref:hypothetical protein n=1 Tax=Paracoccus luteus TaxID=2508543 RepID=UPI00106FA6BE|nr:hypothetical protein [Paracoccus luteus]